MAFKRSSELRPLYPNNGRKILRQNFTDLAYEQWDGLDDSLKDGSRTILSADVINKGAGDIRAYGAVGDGVTDSTSAIFAAQADHKYVYVPEGKYYVTSYKADGLWGPGKLLYLGVQEIILPKSPRIASMVQTILAKFTRSSFGAATIGLVGDSISEGYYATNINNTWFNKLQKMLNVGATGGIANDCEITNLGDPSRYNLTYNGTYSIGSNGPVQQSLILQPGTSVSFTGRYEFVDVVYERSFSGGTLTMSCNGTPFKTVNTSGVASHDICTFPSATGSGLNTDIFTLTASVNSVEITGIWKLNQTNQPSFFFSRLARSAQSTQLFSQDAVLQSTIDHLNSLNGTRKNIVFCAICVNNANTDVSTAGTTPEIYGQQLGKMFARWLNAGFYVIAIGGIYPTTAYPTVRNNYPGIIAMQKQVCEQYGVPLISMDQVDWQRTTAFGGSLLQDGLHPNDAGNEVILELITEFLASSAFDPAGTTQSKISNSYIPAMSWFGGGNAATIGIAKGRYWLDGGRCKVHVNLNNITGATTPTGALTITLPFTANSPMRCSGSVGNITGITSVARGKMWSIQSIPGYGLAVLRSLDPTTGNYDEVTNISNGSLIDFEIEYIVQE